MNKFAELGYGCLTIISVIIGAITGAFGAMIGYGLIASSISGLEIRGTYSLAVLMIGTIGGFIAGGIFAHWTIVKISNRK